MGESPEAFSDSQNVAHGKKWTGVDYRRTCGCCTTHSQRYTQSSGVWYMRLGSIRAEITEITNMNVNILLGGWACGCLRLDTGTMIRKTSVVLRHNDIPVTDGNLLTGELITLGPQFPSREAITTESTVEAVSSQGQCKGGYLATMWIITKKFVFQLTNSLFGNRVLVDVFGMTKFYRNPLPTEQLIIPEGCKAWGWICAHYSKRAL